MFNIPRLMDVMSEILSDRYGCQVILTATPKEKHREEKTA